MAEFHAAGFSEFDKFFGGDSSNDKEDPNDALVAKETKHGKGKRGGVGSTTSTLSLQSSTELSKRLLKVGTKRSRNRDAADDEEEYENAFGDSDDDDEAGRTGISSKESSANSKGNLKGLPPSKKKKLGKKERQKLKEDAVGKNGETLPKGETVEPNENNNDTNDAGDTSTNTKRKPKRRKVRSRQKNIRKDTRIMTEKPKHLRVGASNYQGRPLTDETRAKLNLAPSKSKTGPLFVIDRAPAPNMDEGIALGVEDLLAEPTAVEESSSNKKKKKKKKKSKRKYKNI